MGDVSNATDNLGPCHHRIGNRVTGHPSSPSLELGAIFLVPEDNRDGLSSVECRGCMMEQCRPLMKLHVTDTNWFGTTRPVDLGIFTQTAHEKEDTHGQVGSGAFGRSGGVIEHGFKHIDADGLLSCCSWVYTLKPESCHIETWPLCLRTWCSAQGVSRPVHSK